MYPVLFVAYAAYFLPEQLGEGSSPFVRWLVALAVIWLFGLANVRGTKLVGDSSEAFTYILIAPFVLLSVVGIVKLVIAADRTRSIRSPTRARGSGRRSVRACGS